jgi:hypothetical protein
MLGVLFWDFAQITLGGVIYENIDVHGVSSQMG